MAAFLGRCKGCKATVRIDCVLVEQRRIARGYGRTEYVSIWRMPSGKVERGESHRFGALCLCGRGVLFLRVIGRKSDQACGAKCRSAKGPQCECACAGKNHGAGYSLTE